MKRLIIGPLLFMIMVGEVTVASGNRLFTQAGFFNLIALYLLLFLLFETLVNRFQLTNGRLFFLTFGIYSVIVTGLLHGEIANYVLSPKDNLITSLIRLQCSFFTIFAYQIINQLTKRPGKSSIKLNQVLFLCLLYIVLLTPTKAFGLITLINTFKTAPIHSIIFSFAGISAILFSINSSHKKLNIAQNKTLIYASWLMLLICLVPSVKAFIIIVFLMPLVGIFYLLKQRFRNSKV